MNQSRSNRNTNNKPSRGTTLKQEISSIKRDLQLVPYRVTAPLDPPMRSVNPAVERAVRFLTVPSTGLITPALVAAQDSTLYGVPGPRYTSLTVIGIKVWGDDTTTLGVQHSSGFIAEDIGTPGSRRALVALRIPPGQQETFPVSSTTTIFTITPATIADVIVRFT